MTEHDHLIPQVDGAYDDDLEEDDDTEHDISVDNDNAAGINPVSVCNDQCARFLLTNARSVTPKIDSLCDAFESLKLHFSCLTETWFKAGKSLRERLVDLEGRKGIQTLHRDRRVGNGGGVAFAFNIGLCNFKQRTLKLIRKELEILCAVGRVGKIKRKFVVFTVYIPPSTRSHGYEEICEALRLEVAAAKVSYGDPIIVIGGDLNHRELGGVLDGDFHWIATSPTRGDNVLDVFYTNVPNNLVEQLVLPPLQSNSGISSDHRCVYAAVEFPVERGYHWVTKMKRRKRSREAEVAFARDLRTWNWDELQGSDVIYMVGALEKAVRTLTDLHFPLVRTRRRSTEHPWITASIRKLWRRKLRLYKRNGRCHRWWDTDRRLQTEILEARNGFVDRLLEDDNSGKSFYAATKVLASAAPGPQWSVADLFGDKDTEGICKEVLDFFGGISGSTNVPIPDVRRIDGGLGEFSIGRTATLLGAVKKSTSAVQGDPLPNLVRAFPDDFAIPVSIIFNEINTTGIWPSSWKTEHLTIIPKNPNPSDLSECRNISCTSIFSKVLEGQVLAKLRKELAPDPNQYGGVPKTGVEHMLIELWDSILEALDGGKSAAVLLGVDYEKAFNRMEHGICLRELKTLGASEGSLVLVRAFLEDRQMSIRLDGFQSAPRPIRKGSPQGSVLGCLLYCVTTQRLTLRLRERELGPRLFPGEDSKDESEVRFWDEPASSAPMTFMYVDDTTLFDAVPLDQTIKHFSTSTTTEVFKELALQEDFCLLSERAKAIGMLINQKKTQLLVVNPQNGCITSAEMTVEDAHIRSVDTLKLVGFTFGSSPGVQKHIEAICTKFRTKVWMLYNLRRSGFSGRQLYRLYCCYLRSCIEYCSAVYHAMLTKGQEEALERLHRHAVRICYGFEVDVWEIMAEQGIESLKDRRVRRCDAFIRKAVKSPRFGPKWFPPRPAGDRVLRRRRTIYEPIARSLRRFNSPIVFMARRANELGLEAT